jgi:hypothetical protein
MAVSFYVLNQNGEALDLSRKTRGGPRIPAWKNPYFVGGMISRHDAEELAEAHGGEVVPSNDPRVAGQIAVARKAAAEKNAAQRAAYEESCRLSALHPDVISEEYAGLGGMHCE